MTKQLSTMALWLATILIPAIGYGQPGAGKVENQHAESEALEFPPKVLELQKELDVLVAEAKSATDPDKQRKLREAIEAKVQEQFEAVQSSWRDVIANLEVELEAAKQLHEQRNKNAKQLISNRLQALLDKPQDSVPILRSNQANLDNQRLPKLERVPADIATVASQLVQEQAALVQSLHDAGFDYFTALESRVNLPKQSRNGADLLRLKDKWETTKRQLKLAHELVVIEERQLDAEYTELKQDRLRAGLNARGDEAKDSELARAEAMIYQVQYKRESLEHELKWAGEFDNTHIQPLVDRPEDRPATESTVGAPAHSGDTQISLVLNDSVTDARLDGVNRFAVNVGAAGTLYAVSWRANSLAAFPLDGKGKLGSLTSQSTAPLLGGPLKIALSSDSRLLALPCMNSHCVGLFARQGIAGDPMAKLLDSYDVNMIWPVAARFSPDSKFLYVLDSGGQRTKLNAISSLHIFSIEGDRLKFLDRVTHPQLLGARDFVISSDGRSVFATASQSGRVFLFLRDIETGFLFKPEIVSDADQLAGVHSLAINHENSRLYTISGRTRGEDAIAVFDIASRGKMRIIDRLELQQDSFSGGNDIIVSKDEKMIVVSGSKSNSLAIAEFDCNALKLKPMGYFSDADSPRLKGVSALAFDEHEETLYLGAENSGTVSSYSIKRTGVESR